MRYHVNSWMLFIHEWNTQPGKKNKNKNKKNEK
jgi:hypothetical protein